MSEKAGEAQHALHFLHFAGQVSKFFETHLTLFCISVDSAVVIYRPTELPL